MRALAEPDRRGRRGVLEPPHDVHPGPGRVDDRPRRDRDCRPVDEHLGPRDAPVHRSQLAYLRVVDHRRPGLGRRPDVREAEATVVSDRICIEAAGAQPVEAQARNVLPCVLGWHESLQSSSCER